MLRVDLLTLFPGCFESMLNASMLKRAKEAKKIEVTVHDIRDYATDKHRVCDDRPFGGGPGMVMKPEPIDRLAKKLFKKKPSGDTSFVYVTPQGVPLTQGLAKQLAKKKRIAILCGHYEGVDERVIRKWVTHEISIGDYVLTGGELPALVIIDAVTRLLPGVLGNAASASSDSFDEHLLEYPQYTRPAVFGKSKVPPVLLTGNHAAIEAWRRKESEKKTRLRRPDLYGIYKERAGK